ncbi:cytochrome P450 [Streptomyces sp. NPDC059802]|uniref:cytochrome P450 n=1 Tax=Streptomyces sp. NPDC059802 TaxID=3346952 RepID=UPI00365A14A1
MSRPATELPELPVKRPSGCPFDPPEELAQLREEQPVVPMFFPDGHRGWLVTSHELVRAVLEDNRFSARFELIHSPLHGAGTKGMLPPAPPGMFGGMDLPESGRYRTLLKPRFSSRQMDKLQGRIQEITDGYLDAMEEHGPSVDLVEAYALPIPALVICELLGVPYADREAFQSNAIGVNDNDLPTEEQWACLVAIQEYLTGLVVAKRTNPCDDLMSELTETDLTDEEIANIAALMLGAGFETTANMIALGTWVLLRNPEQLAAFRSDPALTDRTVEELLRYLTITHTGARAALEDVELGGQLIKAGDSIALSNQAANRDPKKFPDPNAFDLHRQAAGHVAFGRGVHLCMGKDLARVEMRVTLPSLFARFPTLRLDIDPEDIPLRFNSDVFGVDRLPVTWDRA